MIITQSDIDIMAKDIKNLIQFMPRDKAFWSKFFDYYNQNHEKRIGMGCRPCFPKVYYFIKKEFEKQQTA